MNVSLQSKLEQDLKSAMRLGDVIRRSVIRYLRSEIHNEEIASQAVLDDDAIIGILSRQAQQRRESIEAYLNGGRQDLVDKEEAELAIILEYMPKQLSKTEIEALVSKTIDEVGAAGPQDIGKVMGRLMPQVRGKAEGREVSEITSELLKGLG